MSFKLEASHATSLIDKSLINTRASIHVIGKKQKKMLGDMFFKLKKTCQIANIIGKNLVNNIENKINNKELKLVRQLAFQARSLLCRKPDRQALSITKH